MAERVTILFIEDSKDDCMLLVRELKRSGFDVDFERVETAEDMELKLNERDWDIVIADFALPRFNGLASLKLFRSKEIDIPFILVSGTISEEMAVEALRSGAQDFILKDKLARFAPAVKRELDEARMRRREKQREKQMMLFFHLSHDLLCVAGFDGYFRTLNPAWEHLMGWSIEEVTQVPYANFIHPDDRAKTQEKEKELQAGGTLSGFENRYLCKDGSYKWLSWNASALPEENIYFATARDVTEAKNALNALLQTQNRFRAFLEQTHLFAVMLDKQGRITFCNDAFLKGSGFTREELIGKNWFEVMLPLSAQDTVKKMFFEHIEAGDVPAYFENEIQAKDGHLDYVLWSNAVLRDAQGQVYGTASIGEDVTERRHAEIQLKESELRYRTLIEQMAAITYIAKLDEKSTTTYISPQVQEILGFSSEEFLRDPDIWIKLIHPEDLPRVLDAVQKCHKERGPFKVEYRIKRKDGRTLWVHDEARIIVDESGQPLFLQGVMVDITDRKMIEEAAQKAKDFYERLFDDFPALIWRAGTDAKCDYFNKGWLEFTDRPFEQEKGDGWVEGVHPEDVDRCVKIYREAFEARKSFVMEYRLRRHDGQYRWLIDHGRPFYGLDNNFAGYIGACFDIQDRRESEKAIEEKMAEIEKLNKFMLGREKRIIELKREVDEILKACNRPERYKA